MSPFYIKKGESLVPLGDKPVDIGFISGIVVVYPQPDSEQIKLDIRGNIIARVEESFVYYPGEKGTVFSPENTVFSPEKNEVDRLSPLIDRRDVILESTTSPERKVIIYSKEPIGDK